MKVFLSWSGERSKQVATLLKTWLKCVIQSVQPWMSSQDISRGELWYNAINTQIANISTGIICLTEENKEKPWILFESGALAKGISTNHIITFLVDLKSDDLLLSPLSAFNHTTPDKDGVLKMVLTINNLLTLPLEDPILGHVFEMFWPTFENQFQEIIANTKNENLAKSKTPASENSDLLKSLLVTVRSLEHNFTNKSASESEDFRRRIHEDMIQYQQKIHVLSNELQHLKKINEVLSLKLKNDRTTRPLSDVQNRQNDMLEDLENDLIGARPG